MNTLLCRTEQGSSTTQPHTSCWTHRNSDRVREQYEQVRTPDRKETTQTKTHTHTHTQTLTLKQIRNTDCRTTIRTNTKTQEQEVMVTVRVGVIDNWCSSSIPRIEKGMDYSYNDNSTMQYIQHNIKYSSIDRVEQKFIDKRNGGWDDDW